MGSETVVYAHLGEDRVVARVAPTFALKTGETVRLAVDAAQVHLFDATSQKSLSVLNEEVVAV
jgi:multiple sugar transport system ATP-binding protein